MSEPDPPGYARLEPELMTSRLRLTQLTHSRWNKDGEIIYLTYRLRGG